MSRNVSGKFSSAWKLILVPMLFVAACNQRSSKEEGSVVATAPATIYDHIRQGDSAAFTEWLNSTTNINERGSSDETPLIVASLYGRTEFVRDLLARGAHLDLIDFQGSTALHTAARGGHSDIIRMLLEAGANPTLADYDGLSAYDIALMMNQEEAGRLLAEARSAYLNASLPVEKPKEEIPTKEISPTLLLSTDFRNWTSVSGDKMEAAFIQSIFDTVVLQSRDGELVRIHINRLIPEDQATIRQLTGLDPHVLARAKTKVASTKKKTDSLSLRVSNDKDWTTLENCKLSRNSANDGDSFHVMHEGKEYIFRLYFVDAPETSDEFPDRVKEQARYFNLDKSATMKLGHAAARFTSSLLASSSFTVITKWEDARGNSQLPRHYAMVVTPMGDLDEILTREGLVRQYGMTIRGSLGDRKSSVLKRLEEEARNEKNGAWQKTEKMVESR